MHPFRRFIHWARHYAGKSWYAPVVGLLAGLDAFVLVIPIEPLLIPSVLLHPKSWRWNAFFVALGSALGACALGAFAYYQGDVILERVLSREIHTPNFQRSVDFVQAHGGWAVFLISLSPIPQQPAVAFAGLSKLALPILFSAVISARMLKYGVICWMASHAPRLFERFKPEE